MKILSLSGGGTKIVGIASAAQTLIERGYKPDVITGVSAGSYLALPLAMGFHDRIETLLSELTLDKMFDPAPVNKKGNITLGAIWRAAKGSYWLGDQTKSLELVRKAITPYDFLAYKAATSSYPDCYTLSVDLKSGSRVLTNLRTLSYEGALQSILASGSIPVYTKGVERVDENGKPVQLLFDGGIRNHIASVPILQKLLAEGRAIEHSVSIFSRPKDYDISKAPDWMPADISTSLTRTLDIMGVEISKKDEEVEQLICAANKIKLDQLFLPSIMQGVYDTDPDRLKTLADAGRIEASKVVFG